MTTTAEIVDRRHRLLEEEVVREGHEELEEQREGEVQVGLVGRGRTRMTKGHQRRIKVSLICRSKSVNTEQPLTLGSAAFRSRSKTDDLGECQVRL